MFSKTKIRMLVTLRISYALISKQQGSYWKLNEPIEETIEETIHGQSVKLRRWRCHLGQTNFVLYSNDRAWSNGQIFLTEILRISNFLDAKVQGKKFLMTIDNCPVHRKCSFLNQALYFLPKNTTSRFQAPDCLFFGVMKVRMKAKGEKLISEKSSEENHSITHAELVKLLAKTLSELEQNVVDTSFANTGVNYFLDKFDDICHWAKSNQENGEKEVQQDRWLIEITKGKTIYQMKAEIEKLS